jgi:hypothetical protein
MSCEVLGWVVINIHRFMTVRDTQNPRRTESKHATFMHFFRTGGGGGGSPTPSQMRRGSKKTCTYIIQITTITKDSLPHAPMLNLNQDENKE